MTSSGSGPDWPMPPEGLPWRLELFEERLDQWIEAEDPPGDLQHVILVWALSRAETPYQGVRRAIGFPNLWYGIVPRARLPSGEVVVCSYFIEERSHTVRCTSFASLGFPV